MISAPPPLAAPAPAAVAVAVADPLAETEAGEPPVAEDSLAAAEEAPNDASLALHYTAPGSYAGGGRADRASAGGMPSVTP